MSKQVSTVHLTTTRNAKLIALMTAAANAALKETVDEQCEFGRDNDCRNGSNQINISDTQHWLPR
jgi:hypothetical protein